MSKVDQHRVDEKMKLLARDPRHKSLRTKRYHGSVKDEVWESSVSMSIRILWRYEDGKIILLMNVGHHDIL
ncbi:MAG: cytotoxin [Defluviitaleaceae bacterium]|nr:cytotoxin [Defluviitaleaceae bacterium]